MSLKKYIKENIYGMPAYMIDGEEIKNFKAFMIVENYDYFNDILSEVDGSDLITAIANGDYGHISSEIQAVEMLINDKLKKEILNFIEEIREDEEGEQDDHGMSTQDFLMREYL